MRYWKPKTIPGNPHVTIVIASYLNDDRRRIDSLQCLLASLMAQTYPHWSAVVVHDGPIDAGRLPLVSKKLESVSSVRISLVQGSRRVQQFGHPYRRDMAARAFGDVIGFANDDGYYAPVYLEWLLSALTDPADNGQVGLVHCDMVHSHQFWKGFPTEPRRGKIDIGCFLVKKTLVQQTPWTDFSFNGDGKYVEALVAKTRTRHVAAQLYVHN